MTTDQLDLFNQPESAYSVDAAEPSFPGNDTAPAPSAPAVIEDSASAAALGGIEDAGEQLVANRRNRGKVGMVWGDIEGLNDTLKVKETVKANVWLKPDYAQLIADGMQPLVAHIVKQVYDSVAAKPAVAAGLGLTDGHLRTYVETVGRIEQGVMQWSRDREALQEWVQKNIASAGAMLGARVALTDLVDSKKLLDRVFPEGWRKHQLAIRMAGGNKLLGALQPGYDEITRAMKAIDGGWPGKREAWEVQGFKVLERPRLEVKQDFKGDRHALMIANHYVSSFESLEAAEQARDAIKPFVLFGKRGYLASFDTEALAIEDAKSRSTKSKGKAGEVGAKGMSVLMAERIGPARRMENEDITSEQLMKEFGFRGVNFGNWLKTGATRAEAQMHLNHAYDAFHDLADILGLPPKAMSLGGMLGLAIGAQGHGGRNAAHFVPGVNEINLTRTSGAGAMAHEWGHALDHNYARLAGLETTADPFLSEHADMPAELRTGELRDGKMVPVVKPRFGELRPEILQAFKSLHQAISKRDQTPEEAESEEARYVERLTKNVNGWLASIRRDFTGLEAEFDALATRIHVGDFGEGRVQAGKQTLLSPVVDEIRELYRTKHGRLYSLDPLKGLQSNIESLAYRQQKQAHAQAMAQGEAGEPAKPRQLTTQYVAKAHAMDKDKGGKPYWQTKCELFARAFDSYVADRLEQKQMTNSYLSFGVRETDDVPVGQERVAIHKAFDALVSEFAVRETEMGPALFSAGREEAAGQPLAEDAIQSVVSSMLGRWNRKPPVIIVDRVQDLPFESPASADGAFHDGKVYLIAENLHSTAQVQKVMAHECVMHSSLLDMLGDYGFAKLHTGIQTLKQKGDATVVGLANEIRKDYGDLPADIETKEIVARAGERCLDGQGEIRVSFGFMKGVFAGVAGWLRDHGIAVPFTNMELQGILHRSGQWARGEHGQEQGRRGHDTKVSTTERVGRFIGRIVGIDGGIVTQKVNREGATVLHSLSDLSAAVKVGDVADIAYQGGKGMVKEQAQRIER